MPGSAASGLPGLLAGYFLRTTVVLTLALLAAAAARRRPAALRHFILSAALIGLLLLPLLSIAPIGWRSPLVPAWMAPAERAGEREIETMIPGQPPAGAAERPAAATLGVENLPDWALYATASSLIGEVRPDGPQASPVPGRNQRYPGSSPYSRYYPICPGQPNYPICFLRPNWQSSVNHH